MREEEHGGKLREGVTPPLPKLAATAGSGGKPLAPVPFGAGWQRRWCVCMQKLTSWSYPMAE